ncbi:holin-like protein [Carboxydocella sporoproducens DSM 16521]|uniref:Holin-like protein n=2 Tax=Carboxydocella TaxID=178898 RepID=A0A1T4M0S1_9FIRM|nr:MULTISPECIES: CidA/LrgA family protein [Carboxydocella]AVX21101.1 holin-like protein [Carboxydocella thermautotrophica]SJZ60487.1 holin-like protein [Carboxydocella sporoproducens DSM 16521]
MLQKWLKILSQWLLLYGIYQLGNYLASLTHVPIPGNVLGMSLLFFALVSGLIPLAWIEAGANLLLKHLAFFFIPISVGLMAWGHLFRQAGLQLFLALLISAAVTILVTGYTAQRLGRKEVEGQ